MSVQPYTGEKPPPYTETVAGHDQGMTIQNQTVASYDQQRQVTVTNQPTTVDGQPTTVVQVTQITMLTYLRHPRRFESKQNAINSLKGFLDVIHDEKSFPGVLLKSSFIKWDYSFIT